MPVSAKSKRAKVRLLYSQLSSQLSIWTGKFQTHIEAQLRATCRAKHTASYKFVCSCKALERLQICGRTVHEARVHDLSTLPNGAVWWQNKLPKYLECGRYAEAHIFVVLEGGTCKGMQVKHLYIQLEL